MRSPKSITFVSQGVFAQGKQTYAVIVIYSTCKMVLTWTCCNDAHVGGTALQPNERQQRVRGGGGRGGGAKHT